MSEGFNRDYDDSDEPITGREVREIINLFKIIARELGRIADRLRPITPPPTAPTPTSISFRQVHEGP